MTSLAFFQKLAPHRRVTTRSAAELTGSEMTAASMALSRLAALGLATRIKPGAWLIGPPEGRPAALVAAAAQPYEAYLSGWSALRYHGRLQQIPQIHFGVTLGRPAEIRAAGTVMQLRHIQPGLFTGYVYDPAAGGLVASAEKALFDMAYFSAMNRKPLGGFLPETDLGGLRWNECRAWLGRIPGASSRTLVERSLRRLRQQNSD